MRTVLIQFGDLVDDTRPSEQRRRVGTGVAAAVVLAVVASASRQPQPVPQTKPIPVPVASSQPIPIAVPVPVPVPVASVPAHATVAPAKMSFQPLTAGSTSPPQLLVVRNDGDEPLSIRRIAVHGAGFQLTNRCGNTLAGHASCNAAVLFAPDNAGDQAGSITVETSVASIDVPLRAAARPIPPVELTPVAFGRYAADAQVTPQRVRFVNSRASAVEIGTVSMASPDPFAIVSNGCRGRVAAGAGCEVMVGVAPRAGTAESELRITSARGDLLAYASVSGSGFVREAEVVHLDMEPRVLHFVSPLMSNGRGGVTPPQRITLSNPSAVPVVIRSVRLVGADRSFKVDAKQCENVTLQPRGGRCVIVVGAVLSNFQLDSMKILVEHSGSTEPDTIGTSAAAR